MFMLLRVAFFLLPFESTFTVGIDPVVSESHPSVEKGVRGKPLTFQISKTILLKDNNRQSEPLPLKTSVVIKTQNRPEHKENGSIRSDAYDSTKNQGKTEIKTSKRDEDMFHGTNGNKISTEKEATKLGSKDVKDWTKSQVKTDIQSNKRDEDLIHGSDGNKNYIDKETALGDKEGISSHEEPIRFEDFKRLQRMYMDIKSTGLKGPISQEYNVLFDKVRKSVLKGKIMLNKEEDEDHDDSDEIESDDAKLVDGIGNTPFEKRFSLKNVQQKPNSFTNFQSFTAPLKATEIKKDFQGEKKSRKMATPNQRNTDPQYRYNWHQSAWQGKLGVLRQQATQRKAKFRYPPQRVPIFDTSSHSYTAAGNLHYNNGQMYHRQDNTLRPFFYQTLTQQNQIYGANNAAQFKNIYEPKSLNNHGKYWYNTVNYIAGHGNGNFYRYYSVPTVGRFYEIRSDYPAGKANLHYINYRYTQLDEDEDCDYGSDDFHGPYFQYGYYGPHQLNFYSRFFYPSQWPYNVNMNDFSTQLSNIRLMYFNIPWPLYSQFQHIYRI